MIEPRKSHPALTEAKAELLRKLVVRLAAFEDRQASEYLQSTGSYGAFDEPSAVRLCRAILKDLELYP